MKDLEVKWKKRKICRLCGLNYGTDRKDDNGLCPNCCAKLNHYERHNPEFKEGIRMKYDL